jgi:hypothetical protein
MGLASIIGMVSLRLKDLLNNFGETYFKYYKDINPHLRSMAKSLSVECYTDRFRIINNSNVRRHVSKLSEERYVQSVNVVSSRIHHAGDLTYPPHVKREQCHLGPIDFNSVMQCLLAR